MQRTERQHKKIYSKIKNASLIVYQISLRHDIELLYIEVIKGGNKKCPKNNNNKTKRLIYRYKDRKV